MNYFKLSLPRQPLSYAHKLAAGVLLFLSFFFMLHPQPYIKNIIPDSPDVLFFSYLQAGDYTLDYKLSDFSSADVLSVFSQTMASSENKIGYSIAQKNIDVGEVTGQLTFHLENDARSIAVCTENRISFISAKLQSVQLLCTDNYLMAFLCFLAAVIILVLGMYIDPQKYRIPLLIAGFGLLASFPMANSFLTLGDDTLFHLTRIESVYQGLRAGEFPVRIGSMQMDGFGDLSATMYPQLFLYPFAALRFANVSLMLCYKLLIAALNIGCSLLTYYSVKNMCDSVKTAILASALYTFSFYRLIDVYYRGALGESLALTFFPLVLWGIYEILWGNPKKWYILAIGISAVMQSHVLSVEMCLFLLIIVTVFWCLAGLKKDFILRIVSGIKAAVAVILLNAWFLAPFLYFCREDLRCFHLSNNISDTVLYLNQMFFSFAHIRGNNPSADVLLGKMSLSVGGILLIGSILFFIIASQNNSHTKEISVGKYCLAYGFFSLFLTSWLMPWDILCQLKIFNAFASSLQFASRFLGIACVLLSVASAIGIKMLEEKIIKNYSVYVGVVILLFICTTYYFEILANDYYAQTSDIMMINGQNSADGMYLYSGDNPLDYSYDDAVIQSLCAEAEYSEFVRKGSGLSVIVTPLEETEDKLLFPIYYYPGYEIRINGKVVDSYCYNSRLACDMPLEKSKIEVRYAGLPVFRIGDFITLITLIACCFYTIRKQIIKKHLFRPKT